MKGSHDHSSRETLVLACYPLTTAEVLHLEVRCRTAARLRRGLKQDGSRTQAMSLQPVHGSTRKVLWTYRSILLFNYVHEAASSIADACWTCYGFSCSWATHVFVFHVIYHPTLAGHEWNPQHWDTDTASLHVMWNLHSFKGSGFWLTIIAMTTLLAFTRPNQCVDSMYFRTPFAGVRKYVGNYFCWGGGIICVLWFQLEVETCRGGRP